LDRLYGLDPIKIASHRKNRPDSRTEAFPRGNGPLLGRVLTGL
jgi:hypothetical protein